MKTIICTFALLISSHMSAFASDVGFTRLTINDPMGGKMLVSLWYPTDEKLGRVQLGPFSFNATRDAEPKLGKSGLVVISHGTAGSDLGHRNVAIELASKGLIVAAPLHPRDNYKDNSGIGQLVVMQGRPLQLSASIDALLSHPTWQQHIDAERIGAFGFSLGGYTVLAALGATPDMSNIIAHCKKITIDPFCNFVGTAGKLIGKQNGEGAEIRLTNVADPRFCAAVIADPVAVAFSNEALSSIASRYIQVWRPEEQNVLLAEAHASRVVLQLNSRKFARQTPEIIVEAAQHYSFIAPFPSELLSVLPSELTRDALQFDREKFQKRFAFEVAEFLSSSLEMCAVKIDD